MIQYKYNKQEVDEHLQGEQNTALGLNILRTQLQWWYFMSRWYNYSDSYVLITQTDQGTKCNILKLWQTLVIGLTH